jgi:hypothetical protein
MSQQALSEGSSASLVPLPTKYLQKSSCRAVAAFGQQARGTSVRLLQHVCKLSWHQKEHPVPVSEAVKGDSLDSGANAKVGLNSNSGKKNSEG